MYVHMHPQQSTCSFTMDIQSQHLHPYPTSYCGQTTTFERERFSSRQSLQLHLFLPFPCALPFRRFFAGSADSASWNLSCAA